VVEHDGDVKAEWPTEPERKRPPGYPEAQTRRQRRRF
jgi:hypothetical protein